MFEQDLRNYIYYSIAGHVALACFLVFRTFFLPSAPLELRNAIRVDVIDLPDKVAQPPPVPIAPTPPKVEIKPPPTAPPKVTSKPKINAKDMEKKAFDKLSAMEAIERFKKETEAKNAKAKQQTFKGNAVNAGDSPTGLDKYMFEEYLSGLKGRVHDNFHIPQWLADSDLHAQALVMIDENGYVIHKEITKSSGNDIFDSMVLESVEKSSPFSAPPARLTNTLKLRGVNFSFPD